VSALRAEWIVAAITWTMAVIFFSLALLLAIVIPFHASDALTFGEWSRLISDDLGWHFSSITGQAYGRPLYYVLQGGLWNLVGFGEPSGRVLSLCFSVLLAAAVAWLVRDRSWGGVASALVVLLLLIVPDFARYVAAGLTDIPTAALVALAGAIVWRVRRPWPRAAGAAAASALAMLAKPSALVALVGLALATLFFRESWRERLLWRVSPILAGLGLALIYDETQARYVHQGLRDFLQAGVNTPYYRDLAAASRRSVLLDGSWLGSTLRTVLAFALVYALLRVAAVRHRRAAATAVPAALLLSWLGPWIAARESDVTVGSLASAGSAVAAGASAILLAFALLAPAEAVASRRELAALLVWIAPPLAGWAWRGVYDTRLLAPAWPALLALVAVAALPAVVSLVARGRIFVVVPFALLALATSDNIYLLDNLQHEGWDQLRRTPTSKWRDRDTTRAIVLPALSRALVATRDGMRDGALLMSPEGAFRFFYPGRVEQSFPSACADLQRFGVFVLTTDQGSRDYMERFLHVPSDPAYWASCPEPHLRQLTDGSEGYAVYDVRS
jgi:4-amino-4-deoxy-L-arabinose transferase-like glycosyltransferase